MEDEEVIVQEIEIQPRNIRFLRSVYYSPEQKKYFRGQLPSGYDQGDFGADLRALILSLKYCGNMSEPKIIEFLENFDVQISSGSVSNILTKTADSFSQEFDELFSTQTGYAALEDRIAKTAAKKDELLTVLSAPSVPLHNNASELQARVSARRRDVSLHSRSVRGARSMDIFTTLVQTSKLLGVNAYAYLRDRISRRFELPSLASAIEAAASG